MSSRRASATIAGALLLAAGAAFAADPTPGYPEPVVQWGVQKGETCDDIATTMYGGAQHAGLLLRYNRIACQKGVPLPEGATLVLPATVTNVPDARLRSINPDVRSKAPGGAWSAAGSGQSLVSSSSVNTLDAGRADIEFVDRTRVFMAPKTLVVIYGTASQSRVSKAPPPIVELQEGEVKAGLAALRGGAAVDVAIPGGGRVSAASRDAVVERKGTRTTVAVFDGKARVASGGKAVEVPKNFGTRFVGVAPPAPPRPLPPAPAWLAGGSGPVVLALADEGVLDASWQPVANAKSYRIELGRDVEMRDLVVREEVAASIVAFHAEKMPPGKYFLTVRAIDQEEYLGVAADQRPIEIIGVRVPAGTGTLQGGAIEVNPYGVLTLEPAPNVEIALDDGPFAPIGLTSIDLARRAPATLRLRARGGASVSDVRVVYTKVAASVEAQPSPDAKTLDVRVAFEGLAGIDVAARVVPRLRARVGDEARDVELVASDGLASAQLALPVGSAHVRLDVVDGRGRALGTWERDVEGAAPPVAAAPRMPRIGIAAPPWTPGVWTSALWWSPTAPDALALGATGGVGDGDVGALGQARATGSWGPAGFEAALRTNPSGDALVADTGAWLGVRARLYRLGLAALEFGPAVRLAVPVTSDGPPLRLEPALALGGASGRTTWLVNAGMRVRLKDDAARAAVPATQELLMLGGTIDLADALRFAAIVDGHLLQAPGGTIGRGGLGLALEGGTSLFGSLAARVSPWSDEQGHVTVGLAIGVREP